MSDSEDVDLGEMDAKDIASLFSPPDTSDQGIQFDDDEPEIVLEAEPDTEPDVVPEPNSPPELEADVQFEQAPPPAVAGSFPSLDDEDFDLVDSDDNLHTNPAEKRRIPTSSRKGPEPIAQPITTPNDHFYPTAAADIIPEFQEYEPTFIEKMLGKKNELRERFAGVDPSPPDSSTVVLEPDDPFLQKLTPLPRSEIIALSAEISADDTIFSRSEHSRSVRQFGHSMAALLTGLSLIIFALLVGPEYLTDTLNNLPYPEWLPTDLPEQAVAGALFALGILVPILSGFVLLDGYRALLNVVARRGTRLLDYILVVPALAVALLALTVCSNGSVTAGLLLIVGYGLVAGLLKRLLGAHRG